MPLPAKPTQPPSAIATPLAQLEICLRQLIDDHKLLLSAVDAHEAALRSCNVDRIERAAREQDLARQRLANTDSRRRVLMHQIARQHRGPTPAPTTLTRLAELFPERTSSLTQLKTELASLIHAVQSKTALLARVAQSVLGHVNATLRLVAHAAAGPGTYTKQGSSPMPPRMGVLNVAA